MTLRLVDVHRRLRNEWLISRALRRIRQTLCSHPHVRLAQEGDRLFVRCDYETDGVELPDRLRRTWP